METSGEPDPAGLIVAFVICNRKRAATWFGSTLGEVCLAPYQFSCWNTSDPNRRRLAHAGTASMSHYEEMVEQALAQSCPDPSQGALYYFTDGIEPPHWASKLTRLPKVGKFNLFR